ncbi:MAG: metallophosphoesterase [Candidatus Babeliales bacterium]
MNFLKKILIIFFVAIFAHNLSANYSSLKELLDDLDSLPEFYVEDINKNIKFCHNEIIINNPLFLSLKSQSRLLLDFMMKKNRPISSLPCPEASRLPCPKMCYDNFFRLINFFINQKLQNICLCNESWYSFNDADFLEYPCLNSYFEKIYVPEDSKICFIGDIHGSIKSLSNDLRKLLVNGLYFENESFKIIKENFHLVFLGDYTDRCLYGIEVLYLILKIATENPGKVFLLKGNHEECSPDDKNIPLVDFYGFKMECELKYPLIHENLLEEIKKLYRFLPAALFIGVEGGEEFVLCNHGGINFDLNLNNFLINQKKYCSISDDDARQLLWSDYEQYKKDGSCFNREPNAYRGGSSEHISAAYMENFFKTSNFKAIFRGHQHSKFGLKMLFTQEQFFTEIEKSRRNILERAENGDRITERFSGLYHWQDVVNKSDFMAKEFLIGNYLPIFTLSTAASPLTFSGNTYDSFVILEIKKTIQDSTLYVYEEPHDKKYKQETQLDIEIDIESSSEPNNMTTTTVTESSPTRETATDPIEEVD